MCTTNIRFEFVINEVSRRLSAGGTWVSGRLDGHCFEALVFIDHAENASWEIGTSRISKLWLKRLTDGRVVYSWDRGLDISPADKAAAAAVRWLGTHLAGRIFNQDTDR